MRKIFNLIIFGLLTSTSCVVAMDEEGLREITSVEQARTEKKLKEINDARDDASTPCPWETSKPSDRTSGDPKGPLAVSTADLEKLKPFDSPWMDDGSGKPISPGTPFDLGNLAGGDADLTQQFFKAAGRRVVTNAYDDLTV
ncbi:MAG: hypothetical protein K2Q34_01295, partial [Alphaproteobacteria bacterium]|nr:hypothetical protein [Alphaproteobacteria bacterium]